MADQDWVTVKIPALMAKSIDKFLETDAAKKNGIFSRADFMIRLAAKFLSDYEKEFGMFASRDTIHGGKATRPID
jgi:hypothetical protein